MNRIRLSTALGLAVAHLRYYRVRTLLAVGGVGLAVLAAVLLAALGVSVLELGDSGIRSIGGDVWVTSTSLSFAPGAVGGIDTALTDTHAKTAEIDARDDVAAARGVHFQTVYVATEPGVYVTVVGAGVTGDGGPFNIEAGETFSGGDEHYANGTYDGPMSGEVLVDRRTAELLDVAVGDEIHIGGTLASADENRFTVVGISNDITNYIGVPTVVLHLGELQQISGATRIDPGSAILVAVDDDADPSAVRDDLEAAYPELTARTTGEQFSAVLQSQSIVLGSAAAVLVLAVVGGIALVANVFGMVVYQQRRQLAALKAVGVSVRTLRLSVLLQGVLVGLIGGGVGAVAVVPGIRLLNYVVAAATGFEGLIVAPAWILGAGVTLAVGVGVVGSTVAGVLVTRVPAVEHLDE